MQKINKLQARKLVAQGRQVFLRPDNRQGTQLNGVTYFGHPLAHNQPFDVQVAEFEAQMGRGARRAAYVIKS